MREFSGLAKHITKLADTYYSKLIALPKPPLPHKYCILCLTSLTAAFVIVAHPQQHVGKEIQGH